MPDLLAAQDILEALRELADELGPGPARHTLVLAGGSVMALHGLRAATRDVDCVAQLDKELKAAAGRVGQRRGLEPGHWLNASAAAWRPQTLHEADCQVVLDHPRLLVLGAPLRQVFLMKLVSLRVRDADDLAVLWPHAGFATPEQAVAALYGQAYPGEEPDEHLADFLRAKLVSAAVIRDAP